MFNPFVQNISELNDSQLHEKVAELTRKYWQSGNLEVRNQISILIKQYQDEQTLRFLRQQSNQDGDSDIDNLININ